MMKKEWRAALLAALLILSGAAAQSAAATDIFYSGALDTETGAPLSAIQVTETNRVNISDGCVYDRSLGLFVYPVGSGLSEVRSSAADGMVLTEPVRISASEGVTPTVYRNGQQLETSALDNISQPGEYSVSARDAGSAVNLFSFTIVGPVSDLAGGYDMPSGFYITDATLDEEEAYFEQTYIDMDDEGAYHVEYMCPATSLHYTLDTIIDRTPPQLSLEGRLDKKGRYHSAVQVSGLEEGDTVSMVLDGENVRFPQNGLLTASGIYSLEAFDSAGNSAKEQFTILVYFDMNSLMFFALVAVSVAGIAGYVIYKRKRLKIV